MYLDDLFFALGTRYATLKKYIQRALTVDNYFQSRIHTHEYISYLSMKQSVINQTNRAKLAVNQSLLDKIGIHVSTLHTRQQSIWLFPLFRNYAQMWILMPQMERLADLRILRGLLYLSNWHETQVPIGQNVDQRCDDVLSHLIKYRTQQFLTVK